MEGGSGRRWKHAVPLLVSGWSHVGAGPEEMKPCVFRGEDGIMVCVCVCMCALSLYVHVYMCV